MLDALKWKRKGAYAAICGDVSLQFLGQDSYGEAFSTVGDWSVKRGDKMVVVRGGNVKQAIHQASNAMNKGLV